MSAFHYTAINKAGEKRKGVIEAESEKHARQLLRNKDLTPLQVSSTHQKSKSTTQRTSQKYRINNKELVLMTRQFATLLEAGIPIEEVLTATAEQTEKPRTKGLILSVRSKVMEGHSLASALKDFPYAFSQLYCATIDAGEKSGHLDIVLQRLADYIEQQYATKQKIKNALIYPTLMIIISIAIVGFLLEYIVPRMIEVYSNVGQNLPSLTQVLISISTGIKEYGLYVLLAIVGIFFFIKHEMKKKLIFRKKIHFYLLKLPIIGNAIKTVNTSRFARTFAILSSAGVPILEAMTISSSLITNLVIHDAVKEATHHVREGASIHLALKQTGYFPAMSIHLIASGETSGRLESMLERAANNQDNEINTLIETALSLFEPAIILLMGAIVLFIVLAVLLPIFQLDQMAG